MTLWWSQLPLALAIGAGTALATLPGLPPGPPPGLAEFGYTLPALRLHRLAAASTSSPAVASWVEQCGVFSVLESPPCPT